MEESMVKVSRKERKAIYAAKARKAVVGLRREAWLRTQARPFGIQVETEHFMEPRHMEVITPRHEAQIVRQRRLAKRIARRMIKV